MNPSELNRPLQFQPLLKRIRWGGRRLGTLLGKWPWSRNCAVTSWRANTPASAAHARSDVFFSIGVQSPGYGYVQPPAKFVGQANLSDPAIADRFSLDNFPECFREYADTLD